MVDKAAPEMIPSQLIDARIQELNDWRGSRLACLRAVILSAQTGIIEEWKWRGVAWRGVAYQCGVSRE